MDLLEILLTSPEETARLGRAIGDSAVAGDVIYLNGELGTGKTTLTKSIAEALGIAYAAVTSPTFSLVHEYLEGRLALYHLDIYRLRSSEEIINLGFDDYVAAADSLIVVEWASNAADMLPEDGLTILLTALPPGDERRKATITAGGSASSTLLARTLEALSC